MPKQPGLPSGSGGEQTPRFPVTEPPSYRGSDYSFTLQSLLELQKSTGRLEEAIGTLKENSKQQGEKLDKINLVIYAATAVLVVLGGILGFLLNKGVDLLIRLTASH